jgi:nucleoside-triphosphatase
MLKMLLIGKPKSGKTSLVRKVLNSLKKTTYGGFFSEEIKEKQLRVGFKIVSTDGEERIMADTIHKSPYRISKYNVNLVEFERVALKALTDAEKEKDLIIIDEIGKMELFSQKFTTLVEEIFIRGHKKVLATIPVSNIPFINKLRALPDIEVIEVTPENRDQLVEKLIGYLE